MTHLDIICAHNRRGRNVNLVKRAQKAHTPYTGIILRGHGWNKADRPPNDNL